MDFEKPHKMDYYQFFGGDYHNPIDPWTGNPIDPQLNGMSSWLCPSVFCSVARHKKKMSGVNGIPKMNLDHPQ
jgi:hypothetical protein